MKLRTLGKTGLEVSVIGFGGIPIQRVSEDEAKKLFDHSLENGINFIDTARGYTISEELIGKAIEGKRDKWILATKSTARDYDGMKKDVEISLKNLKTDYIELYQFHFVKDRETYDQIMGKNGAYKALVEAQAEGKIGHIGITGHDAKLLEEVIPTGKFATVQFPYNPIEYQGENLFKIAKELEMGVIIMKPIAGGAFEKGELSIKYILQNECVTSAIPGMDKMEQVTVNTADDIVNNPLTEEEKKEIAVIVDALGDTFCRRCGYCQPCSEGINIPAQFLLEGYLLRYDLKEWAIDRFKGSDKTAYDCTECGICEPKCPYDLPIREMMKNVQKSFKGVL